MGRKRKPEPVSPGEVGELWRDMMGDDRENLPSLVRHRVLSLYPHLDLADRTRVTGEQLYILLADLMRGQTGGCLDVERVELEAHIDARIPGVFGV